MVTLKDIARQCGVSKATVSKALNGYGDIGKETAEMIRSVAAEMNYLPNPAARQLKTNSSHNIGVLFEDPTMSGLAHEYFSVILNSAKDVVEEMGYDITFISPRIGGSSFVDHCRYRKCDGVLVASADFTRPEVRDLIESEIPTVTIDFTFDNHSSVLSDNVEGNYRLTKYLLDRGHRKIAFIHGEQTSVTKKRLVGFYRALGEYGVEVPEDYIQEARYHDAKACSAAASRLLRLEESADSDHVPRRFRISRRDQRVRGIRPPRSRRYQRDRLRRHQPEPDPPPEAGDLLPGCGGDRPALRQKARGIHRAEEELYSGADPRGGTDPGRRERPDNRMSAF